MFDLLLLLLSFCRPARILRWAAFLLTVAIAWLALENSTLQAYIQERERRNGYREQVDQLKQQQQQLETDIADLKAGGFRLEKAIRERFHLIKPGEKIIYIESPGDKDKAPAPDSREQLNAALLQSAAASPTPALTPTDVDANGDNAPASRKSAAGETPAKPAARKKSAASGEPAGRASAAKKSAGAKSSTKGTESGAKPAKSTAKTKRSKKRATSATEPANQ